MTANESEWQFNLQLALERLQDFENNVKLMCVRFRRKYKTLDRAQECMDEILDSLTQIVLSPEDKTILSLTV